MTLAVKYNKPDCNNDQQKITHIGLSFPFRTLTQARPVDEIHHDQLSLSTAKKRVLHSSLHPGIRTHKATHTYSSAHTSKSYASIKVSLSQSRHKNASSTRIATDYPIAENNGDHRQKAPHDASTTD